MSCLFNSYDPYFKQPFGALRAGQTVRLTLCIPEELGYVDPHLVLQKEGKYDVPVHYRMKFDGQTPQQNHFSVELPLNDPGLYFYYFDLYTDFRRIYRGPDNCGVVSWQEGEKWQITVYDAGFQTPECIKGKVFYQIFPDRFCEGIENKPMPFPDRLYQADKHAEPFWQPNETGGHLNEDYFGGDLEGIRIKLPYLREMGVDYLYLNPIFEAHSNHRYNTADYRRIDPMLGTEEDFRTLCREARCRGIRVMLDGVFNHTGNNSRYFNAQGFYPELGAAQSRESPYYSWYSFHPWPDDYDAWWGIKTLPAVQESTDSYRRFIIRDHDSVVRHWLRQGASGWRLDVADELPDDFIAEIRDAMEQENPDSFLLGEVWEDGSNKVAYSQRRRYLLGSETHGLMNYPFRTAALDWLRGGDAACFRDTMETIREHYPRPAFYSALNILGTHDTPRILTLLGAEHVPDTKDARAAYRLSPEERQKGEARLRVGEMLLYCFPGSPTVYYGDEAGMEGFEDPLNRKTYPWDRQDRALLDFFRSLGQLRRHRPSLQDGDLTYVYAQGGALVLRRQLGDEITVAALNAGETAVEVSLPWPRDLAREALTFQQFFAPGGKLRLRLPPVSGMILI